MNVREGINPVSYLAGYEELAIIKPDGYSLGNFYSKKDLTGELSGFNLITALFLIFGQRIIANNPCNIRVFQKDLYSRRDAGGFDWSSSGHILCYTGEGRLDTEDTIRFLAYLKENGYSLRNRITSSDLLDDIFETDSEESVSEVKSYVYRGYEFFFDKDTGWFEMYDRTGEKRGVDLYKVIKNSKYDYTLSIFIAGAINCVLLKQPFASQA